MLEHLVFHSKIFLEKKICIYLPDNTDFLNVIILFSYLENYWRGRQRCFWSQEGKIMSFMLVTFQRCRPRSTNS